MSNLSGRKVKQLRMHSTSFIEGIGNLKETLDKTVVAKLDMEVTEAGVHVLGTGMTGVNFEFLVPYANCKTINLYPAEAE